MLSGCCRLWTLHDHKTLGDKNWDEFTKPFLKKVRGVWVFVTPAWISLRKNSGMLVVNQFCEPREPRDKVPVLYVILRAQYFWFCLQCAGVLFAACWSFVCSVREFCLQRIILSFAARWNFVCSVREFCFQRVILFLVVCMYFFTVSFLFAVCRRWFVWPIIYVCKEFFICRVFSLLKRCPLWATVVK